MCGICGCGVAGDPAAEHDYHSAHAHGHDHAHDHDHTHGHVHEADVEPRTVRMERALLARNDRLAGRNRAWLAERGVTAFNLIGSPGAGKTTLLERTLVRLREAVSLAVLEGDQATERDAQRIRATGCPVVQINTGTGCHLDAEMVFDAARRLDPAPGGVLLIENVGNLVCPSLFDLGEAAKVVVMSVTEGADKPLKYPHIFRAAQVLVLTKIDLLPHLDLDLGDLVHNACAIRPGLRVFQTSATHEQGLEAWCGWLRAHAEGPAGPREVTPS